MSLYPGTAALLLALAPSFALAQDSAPVATAFRNNAAEFGRNLSAAAEVMPAGTYGFKPTPAQMSFADIIEHLAIGNDYLCGAIGGVKAPARSAISPASGKDALVARLKETFGFCTQVLAALDDAKLSESFSLFGMTLSRAGVEMLTVADWADHYSQLAIYLRLNGQLPPTAKK